MRPSLDWKFFATLLATLAGIVVPVWLWQADQSARSLRLQIVSVTALRPGAAATLDGLTLLLDGHPLDDPYLTVIELTNDGSRPISQTDFETAIEIAAKAPSHIVRVKVAAVLPNDLRPNVSLRDGLVALQPLLLNPKDMLRLTVLSTGGKAELSTRSRIAGIPAISLTSRAEGSKGRKIWIKAITGFLLFVIYQLMAIDIATSVREGTFRVISLFATLVVGMSAGILIETLRESFEVSRFQLFLILCLSAIISTPFSYRRFHNRQRAL